VDASRGGAEQSTSGEDNGVLHNDFDDKELDNE